jgi:hypothetical protein
MGTITIAQLRELCRNLDNVEITQHAFLRFRERKIIVKDVINAILNGEIIEQYPDDHPFPSCLVLGLSTKSLHLHIVCGIGGNKLWVITAYFPALESWENDYKTRKAAQ